MAGDPYNTSSIGWETRQLSRRFGEWIEYRFSQVEGPDLPDWEWPDWLKWDLPDAVGQTLFWLVMSALALWLAWLLYLAVEPAIAEWWAKDQKWNRFGRADQDEEKEHSMQHWWQQAQTLAKAGNYGKACKALYRATLQQLHEREILRHLSSRTDGEYLQGLEKHLAASDATEEGAKVEDGLSVPRPYQLLIGIHERLVFAGTSASAEMFKRCRRAYEEIAKK
ncbi:MAG: DUF4129 domain-containing protein [Cyanobacteria bacterium P01_F01_bin.3]